MACPIPLPRHLISIVAGALHPRDDRQTLVSLSLSSHDGYAAATPILYREIVLSSKGINGLLGIQPTPELMVMLVHRNGAAERLDSVTEDGDLGCNLLEMDHFPNEVLKAKANGSFLHESRSSLRRVHHLRFVRHLRIEDLDINHPFFSIDTRAALTPDAPAARTPSLSGSNAEREESTPPPRIPLLPHLTHASFSDAAVKILSDRRAIGCSTALANLLEGTALHLCIADSSLWATTGFQPIREVFDRPSPANPERASAKSLCFHEMEDFKPVVLSINNLICGYTVEHIARHPPVLEVDGFAEFRPDLRGYTRSGQMRGMLVKGWEDRMEWIYKRLKREKVNIDVVYHFQQADPRGGRWPMRKKDQLLLKEQLDPIMERRLGILDNNDIKCRDRIRTFLRGDLMCDTCGHAI